jgi:hypothetical protein
MAISEQERSRGGPKVVGRTVKMRQDLRISLIKGTGVPMPNFYPPYSGLSLTLKQI